MSSFKQLVDMPHGSTAKMNGTTRPFITWFAPQSSRVSKRKTSGVVRQKQQQKSFDVSITVHSICPPIKHGMTLSQAYTSFESSVAISIRLRQTQRTRKSLTIAASLKANLLATLNHDRSSDGGIQKQGNSSSAQPQSSTSTTLCPMASSLQVQHINKDSNRNPSNDQYRHNATSGL